jgi:hypothetical protein
LKEGAVEFDLSKARKAGFQATKVVRVIEEIAHSLLASSTASGTHHLMLQQCGARFVEANGCCFPMFISGLEWNIRISHSAIRHGQRSRRKSEIFPKPRADWTIYGRQFITGD